MGRRAQTIGERTTHHPLHRPQQTDDTLHLPVAPCPDRPSLQTLLQTLPVVQKDTVADFPFQQQMVQIATDSYRVFQLHRHPLVFVHIGKCAGTYIYRLFAENGLYVQEFHHTRPPFLAGAKYILWVRHPLTRFVSAFHFSKSLIETDASAIKQPTLENCLAPIRIANKKKSGYTFDPAYDELVKTFDNASHLAESLTAADPLLREKAHAPVSSPSEHISKGIGWYLDNGGFIEKHHKDILFVGRVEHMEEDIERLSRKLGFRLEVRDRCKVRMNKDCEQKTLSQLATTNLVHLLRDTDYKALETLHRYGLLPDNTLASCCSDIGKTD